MSDGITALSPKKKKLPFKPTALRRTVSRPSQDGDDDNTGKKSKEDDDDLALFRRGKEMAPIMAADLERRMRKRQKQRELKLELEAKQRRQEAATDKRPREEEMEENLSIVNAPQEEHTPIPEPALEVGAMSLSEDQSVDQAPSETLALPETQPDRIRFAEIVRSAWNTNLNIYSDLVTPPPSKRSRFDSNSSRNVLLSRYSDDDPYPDASPTRRPQSRLVPHTPSRAPNVASSGAPVISLDSDSDSDDVQTAIPPPQLRRSSTNIDILSDNTPQESPAPAEEDEFAEYVRKAEEQRARDRALRSDPDSSQNKETTTILITSELEGVESLMVKFVFDKPLRILRKSWVDYQHKKHAPITEEQYANIVFTWRRQKVYNSSTLVSLGIRPQGEGRLVADSQGADGFTDGRTRVIFEVWTPQGFQEMEHNEELRLRREAGDISDEEGNIAAEPETKLKILLRARGMEDLGLTIRPETTVETLITAFKSQRDMVRGKEVSLWWDGDKLEEHMTMEDAEIEDMDTIEVHVQ